MTPGSCDVRTALLPSPPGSGELVTSNNSFVEAVSLTRYLMGIIQ